jgi:hypothetical protein
MYENRLHILKPNSHTHQPSKKQFNYQSRKRLRDIACYIYTITSDETRRDQNNNPEYHNKVVSLRSRGIFFAPASSESRYHHEELSKALSRF